MASDKILTFPFSGSLKYLFIMNKLITPFGKIIVTIDGQQVDYSAVVYAGYQKAYPELVVYRIYVDLKPDNQDHEIACVLPDMGKVKREIENGERLDCQSFYKDGWKLSLGVTYDEAWDCEEVGDYETKYLDNGISYIAWKNHTQTQTFVFGIAWIDNVDYDDNSDENLARDVQTWYGAAPC